MMADAPMSLFGEDKARREEWRAAHLLLSASVPENLTDVKPPFVWENGPSSTLNPCPSQLIHKEDAAREAAVNRLVENNDEEWRTQVYRRRFT